MITIDKSTWKKVRISDVFDKIEENDKVNAQNRFDRFLKVEHMDAECLRIKRWSSQETGEEINPTFYKIFRVGQVLFPTRNPHLRRTALAHFDGICGEKTLTLEPKREIVDERYIPFLFHSEGFYSHSTSAIIGSTNPHCRWRDIANYEFLLPPKERQAELAELLWAMDEVIEKNLALEQAITNSYDALKTSYFTDSGKKGWKEYSIQDFIDNGSILGIQDGNHGDIHPKSSDYIEDGIPFVMANILNNGSIDFSMSKKLPQVITDKLRIGFAKPNDVLLSHKGTVGEVAIVPREIAWPYLMLTPQVTYYRPNNQKLDSKFLYYAMSSAVFQSTLKRVSSQSTRAYVGITEQKKLKILAPLTLKEQIEVVEDLHKFELNIRITESKISASKALQKSLINEVF